MFNRVAFPSLAEGVEAGEIEIPYFLISAHFVIEFISVSAPAKQGVSRVQSLWGGITGHKFYHRGIGLFHVVPFTFPKNLDLQTVRVLQNFDLIVKLSPENPIGYSRQGVRLMGFKAAAVPVEDAPCVF